jgi:quinol monooxygenase YgiN
MSILVIGTVRIPADRIKAFHPYMKAMVDFSRAEDGCLLYAYAEDVLEPGLLRVTELWRDEAALAAHLTAPHLAEWRSSWSKFGVSERRLFAYEVGAPEEV